MSELVRKVKELESRYSAGKVSNEQYRDAVMEAMSAHFNEPLTMQDAKMVLTVLSGMVTKGILEKGVYDEILQFMKARFGGGQQQAQAAAPAPPPAGVPPRAASRPGRSGDPGGSFSLDMPRRRSPGKGLGTLLLIALVVAALGAGAYFYGPGLLIKQDIKKNFKGNPFASLDSLGSVTYNHATKTAVIKDVLLRVNNPSAPFAVTIGQLEITNPNAQLWKFMKPGDIPSGVRFADVSATLTAGGSAPVVTLGDFTISGYKESGTLDLINISNLKVNYMGMVNVDVQSLNMANLDFAAMKDQMGMMAMGVMNFDSINPATYDKFEIQGLHVSYNVPFGEMPMKGSFSLGSMTASNPKQASPDIIDMESMMSGLSFDTAMITDPMAKDFIAGMGYDKIVLDGMGTFKWNAAAGDYEVPRAVLKLRDAMDIAVSFKFADVTKDKVTGMSAAMTNPLDALADSSLVSFELKVLDHSLTSKLLDRIALLQGTSKDQLIAGMEENLWASVNMAGDSPEATRAVDHILAFLRDPQSLSVTINPDAPVKFSNLTGSSGLPAGAILGALKLQVTANSLENLN